MSRIVEFHLNRGRNPLKVDWSAYNFVALVQLPVGMIALSSELDRSLGAPRVDMLADLTVAAASMAPRRLTDDHVRAQAKGGR